MTTSTNSQSLSDVLTNGLSDLINAGVAIGINHASTTTPAPAATVSTASGTTLLNNPYVLVGGVLLLAVGIFAVVKMK